MSPRKPEVLLDGLVFPEGPRWHDGRLWFSDMGAGEVVAVDLQGRRETILSRGQGVSGLGWLPDGRLLVVSMPDRKLLRLDPDGLVEAADLSALASFNCNDMVVDAQGRAYVGNFGFDFARGEAPKGANLILVTPDGQTRVAAGDLVFPNGTVISPDGRTLVVAETFGLRLTAFDVAADGSLSNRRVWATLDGPPDGICLDAEGCIWVAVPNPPFRFLRVAEGGEVKERIEVADRGAYACALGGPDRRLLFLLEAVQGAPSRTGRIRVVEVEVPGAGIP